MLPFGKGRARAFIRPTTVTLKKDSKNLVNGWLETLPGHIYEYLYEETPDVMRLPRNTLGLGA